MIVLAKNLRPGEKFSLLTKKSSTTFEAVEIQQVKNKTTVVAKTHTSSRKRTFQNLRSVKLV